MGKNLTINIRNRLIKKHPNKHLHRLQANPPKKINKIIKPIRQWILQLYIKLQNGWNRNNSLAKTIKKCIKINTIIKIIDRRQKNYNNSYF